MVTIAGPRSGNFLSQLGIEVDNLGRDVGAAAAAMPAMMQSLQGLFGGGAAAGAFPGAFPNPSQDGQIKQTLTKLAFVSVLQEAMDKASKNPHFNLETAINDMWVHLEAVGKLAGATSSADSEAALIRLQQSMQRRGQLFSMISEIMKSQHDSQMSAIRNLR